MATSNLSSASTPNPSTSASTPAAVAAAAAETTKSLLARAHSPDTTNRIYSEKIQYRNLYLRPSSPPPSVTASRQNERNRRLRAREAKKARQKQKPAPLSARQRRRLGLYELPRGRKGDGQHQETRYTFFEPLNRLWLGYAREILGQYDLYATSSNVGASAGAKLSSAEFHGAEVEVSRSGCPSRVGIKGIVVKDTKFTFEVVTRDNEIKIVPKEGTMFRVVIPLGEPEDGKEKAEAEEGDDSDAATPRQFVFELLGDQLLLRGGERANKKFRSHFLKDV